MSEIHYKCKNKSNKCLEKRFTCPILIIVGQNNNHNVNNEIRMDQLEDNLMEIKEVMTESPTYCHPDSTLRETARIMKSLDTGVVPVGDGEKLQGMITDRDITLSLANNADPDTAKARDVMHEGVYYCYQEDSIEKAAQDMGKLQVHRLIVLDNRENKKMVGIISIGDIARETHDKKTCGEVIDKVSEEREQRAH